MRRYILLLLLFVPAAATAQREVAVRELRLVQNPTEIVLDFTLAAGSRAAASGTTLVLTPMLVRGERSVELTPVVVQGRRASILNRRGGMTLDPEAIVIRNGGRAACRAVLPFEEWMPGAALVLRGESEGCATIETFIGTLAEGVIVPVADFTVTERVVAPGDPRTTADRLAEQFPFLHPAQSDYDDGPFSLRPARGERGVTVFFHQGRDNIVPDYRNNYRSLVDLLSVIEEINRAGDSSIDRIAITGFASPEGDHESNMRLSERRAEAMRRVIAQNSPAIAAQIRIYAGGEDWEGLRQLVAASNMRRREEILRIIDRRDEAELMRLDGGRVYREMLNTLYPVLREATFIVVYYKNNDID